MILVSICRTELTSWALDQYALSLRGKIRAKAANERLPQASAEPDNSNGASTEVARSENSDFKRTVSLFQERIVAARALNSHSNLLLEFERIASALEVVSVQARGALERKIVVVVDYVNVNALPAWWWAEEWESLVAALILAFPEISWCFACATASTASKSSKLPLLVTLDKIFEHGPLEVMFDGAGLREWIRSEVSDKSKTNKDAIPAKRGRRCGVIDDEPSAAYYHAYCAYRSGNRVSVATTLGDMDRLFKEEELQTASQFAFTLEDINLGFPDKRDDTALSDLEARGEGYPGLGAAENRWIITTESFDAHSKETREKNNKFINQTIPKPTSDILGLTKNARLILPKFEYLHTKPSGRKKDEPSSHSAHGRLQMVALVLLQRANARLTEVRGVRSAILGAVIASDALELTAGKSPATALEALCLKHQFEVLAECQSVASGYHSEANARIQEIKDDCTTITQWYGMRQKTRACLNSQMSIANALLRQYRGSGQFEEEARYARWTRELEDELAKRGNCVERFARWYLRWSSTSLLQLCYVMLGWIVFLAIAFSLSSLKAPPVWLWPWDPGSSISLFDSPMIRQVACGLSDAVSSFFSIGPPFRAGDKLCGKGEDLDFSYAAVVSISIVAGALHLGLFVAMLVSRLNRK